MTLSEENQKMLRDRAKQILGGALGDAFATQAEMSFQGAGDVQGALQGDQQALGNIGGRLALGAAAAGGATLAPSIAGAVGGTTSVFGSGTTATLLKFFVVSQAANLVGGEVGEYWRGIAQTGEFRFTSALASIEEAVDMRGVSLSENEARKAGFAAGLDQQFIDFKIQESKNNNVNIARTQALPSGFRKPTETLEQAFSRFKTEGENVTKAEQASIAELESTSMTQSQKIDEFKKKGITDQATANRAGLGEEFRNLSNEIQRTAQTPQAQKNLSLVMESQKAAPKPKVPIPEEAAAQASLIGGSSKVKVPASFEDPAKLEEIKRKLKQQGRI